MRYFCNDCFQYMTAIKKDETDSFIRTIYVCSECSKEDSTKYRVAYSAKPGKELIQEDIDEFEKQFHTR